MLLAGKKKEGGEELIVERLNAADLLACRTGGKKGGLSTIPLNREKKGGEGGGRKSVFFRPLTSRLGEGRKEGRLAKVATPSRRPVVEEKSKKEQKVCKDGWSWPFPSRSVRGGKEKKGGVAAHRNSRGREKEKTGPSFS